MSKDVIVTQVQTQVEQYGYRTIDVDKFDGISINDWTIEMGKGENKLTVFSCAKDFQDMKGKLPKLYCVRQNNGRYAEFMCGLDLLNDGTIWIGLSMESRNIKFENIDVALEYLKSKLGHFEIHTEEPLLIR